MFIIIHIEYQSNTDINNDYYKLQIATTILIVVEDESISIFNILLDMVYYSIYRL